MFDAAAGAVGEQFGLVVVEAGVSARRMKSRSSSPLNMGMLRPGSKMKGMLAAAKSRALQHASRPSGATMPRLASGAWSTC